MAKHLTEAQAAILGVYREHGTFAIYDLSRLDAVPDPVRQRMSERV
ncbi:MAG: hypothetical protein QGF53_04305 [Alphaproteobacteria bacterium]|nr:hypothetical protein [Alphaproteobacteria bacterium]